MLTAILYVLGLILAVWAFSATGAWLIAEGLEDDSALYLASGGLAEMIAAKSAHWLWRVLQALP
jgi:hypothetical protein